MNSGVLIICCVCSCPGVLAGIWGWRDFLFPISIDLCVFCVLCVFMPGRVSRDMGLVWFLISCLCWFVSFIRFAWSCPGVLAGTWGWCGSLFPISIDLIFFNRFGWFCVALTETKESDQFRSSFLHYNIPLSLKLINLFCPVSVTRVYPEW